MAFRAVQRPPAPLGVSYLTSSRVSRACIRTRAAKDDLDPIERAVGWLFGKQAVHDRKPFGLSRLEGTALEQQYEADTTDRAAPLRGDSQDIARFRSVLAHTVLEKEPLRLAYSASKHGWDPRAFHRHVRNQGAAVVVAETANGALLGGYNPWGWEGLGDQLDSRAAFLFIWPDGDTEQPAYFLAGTGGLCALMLALTILPGCLYQVGGPGLAIMDDGDNGPRFGAEGLSIPLQPDSPKTVNCRLGTFYSNMPDGSRSLFPEGRSTQLVHLKVYVAGT